jgi:hypothetical protein
MNAATLRFAGLGGHGHTWGLCVDGHLVAGTDEPMTLEHCPAVQPRDPPRPVTLADVRRGRGHLATLGRSPVPW